MANWNASQYLKFEKERTQPSIDLAGRIPLRNPKRILDIGCGPGNSTAVLRQHYPNAQISGIDSSQDMVTAATQTYPDLDFQLCDAVTGLSSLSSDYDIVFSNACIQWLPEHQKRLPEMLSRLRPGGFLAIQTPMNDKEPIHTIIEGLAKAQPWREKLSFQRIFYNLTPAEYFDLLTGAAGDFTLWETTYYHTLSSHRDIMQWYRGTGLRPYLQALAPQDAACFEAEVFARVKDAYPLQADGRVIFRFPRFFMLAEK